MCGCGVGDTGCDLLEQYDLLGVSVNRLGSHLGTYETGNSAKRTGAPVSKASRSLLLALRSMRSFWKSRPGLVVEADQLHVESLQQWTGAQDAVEKDPQHTSRFPADLDTSVVYLGGNAGHGCHSGLCAREVVGRAEGLADLVPAGPIHRAA